MRKTTPLPVRFWAKVDTSGGPDACWPWTAARNVAGYGRFENKYAHRVAYELAVGAIPAGLHVDHQCHNRDLTCLAGSHCLHRRCVNPAHLLATTSGDNTRRACARIVRCKQGHAYSQANTYRSNSGHRSCRACARIRAAKCLAARPKKIRVRKTHCKRGHEFTPENTILHSSGSGQRACRECKVEWTRQYRARMKAI